MNDIQGQPTEYGDVNRQIKTLMEQYLNGDRDAMNKIMRLARRREKMLAPKRYSEEEENT